MESENSRLFRKVILSLREETLSSVLEEPLLGEEVSFVSAHRCHLTSWLHRSDGHSSPVLFEIHGGGFCLGDARKEDALCAWIRDRWGIAVVGVNYRMTPEHPFPAAFDDVCDVITHFVDGRATYGIDPRRVYVMGYSAGANLALEAAMRLNSMHPRAVAGLLLHYPFLDNAQGPQGDHEPRPEDLSPEFVRASEEWYVGERDPRDPLLSPLRATDEMLSTLPETLLFPVEGDVLAGEAVRLASRITAVGGKAPLHTVAGTYHGFIEDAANPRVYREISVGDLSEARLANATETARDVLVESLSELLGSEGTGLEPAFLST